MSYFFIIVLGLTFGSFMNVVIFRLPKNIFLKNNRSFCPNCKRNIPFYQNIPIFSYLIQRGKCYYCKDTISIQYPIVELISLFIWIWAFNQYQIHEALLFIWTSSILTIIAFIDQQTFLIPFQMIISAISGFILYKFLFPSALIPSISGLIIGVGYISLVFIITSVIFKKQTLGYGDLQLIAVIGLWLGPINVLLCVFFSSLFSLIVWSYISFKKGYKQRKAFPFGPYLSAVSIILYMLKFNLSDLFNY